MHFVFLTSIFNSEKKAPINTIPAMILPELKGSPIVFTKNNSVELKNCKVYGNKNLKTKANINTDITDAIVVVFKFIVWYILKKYSITIAGITNKDNMCTPKDNPTTKLISSSHLFPLGRCISLSHLKPSQNKIAIKKRTLHILHLQLH